MITQKELKELLYYNTDTGIFIWNHRDAGFFSSERDCASWNNKNSGMIAGAMSSKGYLVIKIFGKSYLAHRLAWIYVTGETPMQIDHVNRNKEDNRIANLRNVTNSINHKNMPKQENNKSGVTGVSFCSSRGIWMAYIHRDKKRAYLGRFAHKFEAICARKSAELSCGYHESHGK